MTEPPHGGKFITAAEQPDESQLLTESEGMAVEPITQWDMFWTRLRRHRLAMISAGVMAFLVVVVLAAPLMEAAGWIDSPLERLVDDGGRTLRNIAPRLSDGTVNILPPGEEAHPATATALIFGSDDLGRGVFTRVIYGGRASLTVGFVTGMIVAFLGTMVGSIAGYYPGGVDQSLMRFTDLVLGLPLLPIAIVVGRILPELDFLPSWLTKGPMGIALL
ncbi:MAG: ABC transporter permease, partial [Acidimicrobiia bacterium]